MPSWPTPEQLERFERSIMWLSLCFRSKRQPWASFFFGGYMRRFGAACLTTKWGFHSVDSLGCKIISSPPLILWSKTLSSSGYMDSGSLRFVSHSFLVIIQWQSGDRNRDRSKGFWDFYGNRWREREANSSFARFDLILECVPFADYLEYCSRSSSAWGDHRWIGFQVMEFSLVAIHFSSVRLQVVVHQLRISAGLSVGMQPLYNRKVFATTSGQRIWRVW